VGTHEVVLAHNGEDEGVAVRDPGRSHEPMLGAHRHCEKESAGRATEGRSILTDVENWRTAASLG
jgi:hypothetical protein